MERTFYVAASFVVFLFYSLNSAAADPPVTCPTQDQISGDVQKVSDALPDLAAAVNKAKGASPMGGAAPGTPGPQLLLAAVSVVEEDAKLEARIWVQNEILDNLCADSVIAPRLPDVCTSNITSGNSKSGKRTLEGAGLAGTSSQFNAEIGALRADLKQLPGCLFYEEVLSKSSGKPSGDQEYVPYIGYYLIQPKGTNPRTVSSAAAVDLLENEAVLPALDPGAKSKLDATKKLLPEHFDVIAKAAQLAEQGQYNKAIIQMSVGATGALCPASPDQSRGCKDLAFVTALADTGGDQKSATDVLDSYVDVYGSMKRKATTPWMVSLDGIGGAQVGYQRLSGSGGTASSSIKGLFLPIGVQVTWPLRDGYIGGMLAPVEAGSLASLSSSETTSAGSTASTSSASIKKAIAPGVYLTYTFANYDWANSTPFTIGVGANHSSAATTLTAEDGTTRNIGGTRYVFFIGWDITLFGF